MANVRLIEYTGKGRNDQQWHAAHLLMFTKATRLNMDAQLFEAIAGQTVETKMEQLNYMAKTIPSSWEFVDVTFLITGVSRASAQQITRTRTASYAMQSQRVTDVRSIGVVNPFEPDTRDHALFETACVTSAKMYEGLVDGGMSLENARGVLPLATKCNLVAKYNLRNFVDLMRARASLRVQGEYSDIADQMKAAVIEAWPWSAVFFVHPQDAAIKMLEGVASEIGIETGKGAGWEIAKAIDLLRKSS